MSDNKKATVGRELEKVNHCIYVENDVHNHEITIYSEEGKVSARGKEVEALIAILNHQIHEWK